MQRARLHHPLVATDAAGKLRQARFEFIDIALAPARDLPKRRDAELVEHALEHRPHTHDQLEIVRRPRTIEERRWRIGLDVDHELAIPRGLAAGLREIAFEPAPV